MKVYKKQTAVLLLCSLALSGCLTGALWESNSNHRSYKKDGEDRVHAFALTDTQQGRTLLMLGDKYSYGVTDKELIDAMTSGLSQRFIIYEDFLYNKKLSAVPVNLSDNDGEHFSSSFCLGYPIEAVGDGQKPAETAKLEQLGFKQETKAFARCFNHVQGRIYTPQNLVKIPPSYRFEQGVPVELRRLKLNYGTAAASTLGKIIITPAALAADAVLLPVTLPFLMTSSSWN
ncbi:hypothetical protein [Neisseria dentiae]|uniref:hypothetical protein n=1 Tax=Neisseria dentiae TaxID=194197 RepID=UPI00359F905E